MGTPDDQAEAAWALRAERSRAGMAASAFEAVSSSYPRLRRRISTASSRSVSLAMATRPR